MSVRWTNGPKQVPSTHTAPLDCSLHQRFCSLATPPPPPPLLSPPLLPTLTCSRISSNTIGRSSSLTSSPSYLRGGEKKEEEKKEEGGMNGEPPHYTSAATELFHIPHSLLALLPFPHNSPLPLSLPLSPSPPAHFWKKLSVSSRSCHFATNSCTEASMDGTNTLLIFSSLTTSTSSPFLP